MSNLQEDRFKAVITNVFSLFNVHKWCMHSLNGLTLSKDAVNDLLDTHNANRQLDGIPQSVLVNLDKIITTIKECIFKVVSSRFVASRMPDIQENMLKTIVINAFSLFDVVNWYKLSVNGLTISKDAVRGILEKYVESLISESHVCSSECPLEFPFSHQKDKNVMFHTELLSAPVISSEPKDETHLINVAPVLISSIVTTNPSTSANIARSIYNIQNNSSNNHELSENEENSVNKPSETETAILETTTTRRMKKSTSKPVNSSETAKGQHQPSNNDELPENEKNSRNESSQSEMINTGSTKPGRVMKLVLTPLYLSEMTKRQSQPTDNDGLPESEERSKDEPSQSEMTSVGFTTSNRMRKRHFTSIGSTKTMKRQRQS